MTKVTIRNVYSVDLNLYKMSAVHGLSADVKVNCKIAIHIKHDIKLSLKGTKLKSKLLGDLKIKGELLEIIEKAMLDDIRNICDYQVCTHKLDKIFFNFSKYLKLIMNNKKINAFVNGNTGKLLKVKDKIIEELNMCKIEQIGGVLIPDAKLIFVSEVRTGISFGLIRTEDGLYIHKRVVKKNLELFLSIGAVLYKK